MMECLSIFVAAMGHLWEPGPDRDTPFSELLKN